MSKRFLLFFLATTLWGIASLSADEKVRAVQNRLKEDGFYFREATGVYDSETAAAVSRYQIRHGLEISGKIDAPTLKALGLETTTPELSQPRTEREAWPLLRKRNDEFLAGRKSRAPASPQPSLESAIPPATSAKKSPPADPLSIPGAKETEYSWSPAFDHERLRDYVGAFVLAGLDPKAGAELEFFAEKVNYFNEANVPREKIRRDLVRYNERWPERRFWLEGDLRVEPKPNSRLQITFPLRFELRNQKKSRSGKVLKSLVVEEAGDDLRIVAVDEVKAR